MKPCSIIFAVVLIVVSGCEERIEAPLAAMDTNVVVVEAVITNERKNHLVKLSSPYTQQNDAPDPVTGAAVYVLEDTTVFALAEFPPGSGNYYTPMMRGLFGKLYTLVIQHQGAVYYAQDSPSPVQPMGALSYRETDRGYTINFSPEGQDANYVEHVITWKHTSGCPPGDDCNARLMYYDLKTIDVNEIYKPDRELFHFPSESVVIRRKYAVSPGYKNFLRSMLSETQWRGGVFDVQRSNVPTNLSEGAMGFFAVCSVQSDTTLIN